MRAAERIAVDVRDAAGFLGCSESSIRARIDEGSLAALRLGHRVLVLVDDLFPSVDHDGRHGLAGAFRGRRHLHLAELAAALGISARHAKDLVHEQGLPAWRRGRGWWTVLREDAVRWLLRQRVAPRWETAVA